MSESHYGDFRKRREETVWHSLNRVVLALIVFVVCILVVCAFLPLLKQDHEMTERVRDLTAQAARNKAQLDQETRKLDHLRNDPAYVEMIARDRLDLMKEGETILRLDTVPTKDK